MPPPFAEQDKIQKTLDRIGRNDVTLSFVDWSCAEVDDEYLEKLGTALKGNTFVRKVHLNFNPAVTDAGAAALEAALPGCNVVAVWADNTGASEAARARLHLLCVTNAVRLIATNDEHLTSINWNLVDVPDEGFDTAPLVAASRAAEPQWSVKGAPVSPYTVAAHRRRVPLHRTPCVHGETRLPSFKTPARVRACACSAGRTHSGRSQEVVVRSGGSFAGLLLSAFRFHPL